MTIANKKELIIAAGENDDLHFNSTDDKSVTICINTNCKVSVNRHQAKIIMAYLNDVFDYNIDFN